MSLRASYRAWRELGAPRRRAARRAVQSARDRRALRRKLRRGYRDLDPFARPLVLHPHDADTSRRHLGPAFDLEYRERRR